MAKTSPKQTVTTPKGVIPEQQRYIDKYGIVREPKPARPESMVTYITSLPGCGKTYFAASNPDTVLLDFENKGGNIPWNVARVNFTDCKDLETFCKDIHSDAVKGKSPFPHLTIDSMDSMTPMIERYLEETDPALVNNGKRVFEYGKGTGYAILNGYVRDLFEPLIEAGLGLTLIGHLSETRIEKNSGEVVYKWRAAMYPKMFEWVYRVSEFMGYIRRETEYTGTGRDRVPEYTYWMQLATWDEEGEIPIATKSRFLAHMPEFMEIPAGQGWKVFRDAWDKAVKETGFTIEKGK